MKTLEQIKNDYAVIKGFNNFNDLVNWCHNGINNGLLIRYIDEVMKIYAMECLKLASENAKVESKNFSDGVYYRVKEESITNENNLIK